MQWDTGKFTGFDWDAGNSTQNLDKHAVSGEQAEQIFVNAPVKILTDRVHSKIEARFHAFGRTNDSRFLTVAFTVRGSLIRIISARPMSRKERKFYEKV
jgi:uncharacterized DUF497 family protein